MLNYFYQVVPVSKTDVAVARVGRIDRSIQGVSSRPDMFCTFVTFDS
jgi:hypothetical protein